MNPQSNSATHRSIRRHVMAGIVIVVLLAGGVGGWAATTELSSALIAQGSMVVDSNVKKVQHPTGGIVGELRARDGDHVKMGDVLVRLDDTVTRANLSIIDKGLVEFEARKARLEAERDGTDDVAFPDDLRKRMGEPAVARVLAGERKLFELRRSARDGQKAQLQERVAQLREEVHGLTAQQEAKSGEIELIHKELSGVRELWNKNLIQITRLTALEREATRLGGERAQLTAAIAQAKGRIAETELQIIQIGQDLSSEVAKELRDIEGKIGEFIERRVTAEDQLKRIDIRAPQDGMVFQSNAHTVGGVIPPGDAIMLIVPEGDNLLVEAKVNPQDIDKVRIGQDAVLRFSAFNMHTTPEIDGQVMRVSADITTDQRTGMAFYTARIAITSQGLGKLEGLKLKLVPGMPVEVFIQTGERTVITYLMKPLLDQFARAFREK